MSQDGHKDDQEGQFSFQIKQKQKIMSKSSSIHFVQCNEIELPSQLWKEFIPNLSLKLLVSLVTVFNIFQSVFGR